MQVVYKRRGKPPVAGSATEVRGTVMAVDPTSECRLVFKYGHARSAYVLIVFASALACTVKEDLNKVFLRIGNEDTSEDHPFESAEDTEIVGSVVGKTEAEYTLSPSRYCQKRLSLVATTKGSEGQIELWYKNHKAPKSRPIPFNRPNGIVPLTTTLEQFIKQNSWQAEYFLGKSSFVWTGFSKAETKLSFEDLGAEGGKAYSFEVSVEGEEEPSLGKWEVRSCHRRRRLAV